MKMTDRESLPAYSDPSIAHRWAFLAHPAIGFSVVLKPAAPDIQTHLALYSNVFTGWLHSGHENDGPGITPSVQRSKNHEAVNSGWKFPLRSAPRFFKITDRRQILFGDFFKLDLLPAWADALHQFKEPPRPAPRSVRGFRGWLG